MEDARLYRQYAEECKAIARTLPPGQRERLLEVAEAWDRCAAEATPKGDGYDDQQPPAQTVEQPKEAE